MTSTDSDALVIARWFGSLGVGFNFNASLSVDVASAERILIERGHAEAYGRALAVEFGFRTPLIMDGHGSEHALRLATAATAPLDARVRALAAVIRSLEIPRG